MKTLRRFAYLWGALMFSGTQASGQATTATTAVQHVRVPVVEITVKPHGFETTAATISAGPFFLVFKNLSGLQQVAFQVEPTAGTSATAASATATSTLKNVLMSPARTGSATLYNLPAGKYTITETLHPAWICTLTIN